MHIVLDDDEVVSGTEVGPDGGGNSRALGDAEIRVKITDSAYNALMLVPFTWVTNTGYEKETETGYEKAVKIAGFPGLEKWNTESKDGELTLVANKRYIVELEGDGIDDSKVLHQLAESMTLGKLPAQ